MADQRIKGQEVVVSIIADGQTQDEITEIRDFEIEPQLDIKKEGYLGEPTDRRDEVYNGCSGKLSMHFSSAGVFDLMQSVMDRAKRKVPGTQINIKATLNFPNGDRKRVLVSDAFFGGMPMNFGSRTDYGAISLSFEAQDLQFI